MRGSVCTARRTWRDVQPPRPVRDARVLVLPYVGRGVQHHAGALVRHAELVRVNLVGRQGPRVHVPFKAKWREEWKAGTQVVRLYSHV